MVGQWCETWSQWLSTLCLSQEWQSVLYQWQSLPALKWASAPEEEHLFAGMHHSTVHSTVWELVLARLMWSQNVCLLNVSLLPCSFRPACHGEDWERSYWGFTCVLPINSWLPGLQSMTGPLLDCQLSSHPNIDIHSLNLSLTAIVGLSLTLAEVHFFVLEINRSIKYEIK